MIASSARLPTVRAYGIAVASLQHSLEMLGFDCVVAAPSAGVEGVPQVNMCLNSVVWSAARRLQGTNVLAPMATWSARLAAASTFAHKARAFQVDLLWTRDAELAVASRHSVDHAILELHHCPSQIESRLIAHACRILGSRLTVVAISKRVALAAESALRNGAGLILEPSGVGSEFFLDSKKWPMPYDPVHLLYIGSFSSGTGNRGCEIYVEMAEALLRNGVNFRMELIGGDPHQVGSLNALRTEFGVPGDLCRIRERVAPGEVPQKMAWADVLLANYPETLSSRHESPLKLVEYAASQRPILASASSSVAGTLPRGTYFPYDEGDAHSLLDAFSEASGSETLRETTVAAALEWALNRTWRKRTERILAFGGIKPLDD